MILGILLLSCAVIANCQIYNSCPSPENIEPCTCVLDQETRMDISCADLKSSVQLTKAAVNMKNYSISTFYLKNSNIGVLPSDAFIGMDIHTLTITKSNLTRLGDSRNRPPFLGLENSLVSIDIKESFPETNKPLSSLSLSHLKRLHSLQLDGNPMPTIGNNWFESGPYGLKELRLLNTNTSVIGSHAFEPLGKLEYFSLTGGQSPEITREMLPMPATYLMSMDLRNNMLSSLPSNLFQQMPALEQLYLENNEFTTIDEVVFAPIWGQLEYVYFHGNPIRCDSDLKWIYKYRLPEHFGGYCKSPFKLLNKDLKTLTASDLEETTKSPM